MSTESLGTSKKNRLSAVPPLSTILFCRKGWCNPISSRSLRLTEEFRRYESERNKQQDIDDIVS
jgi:hypothetical protein